MIRHIISYCARNLKVKTSAIGFEIQLSLHYYSVQDDKARGYSISC